MNSIPKKLTDFLDGKKAKYKVISHPEAFTAQETAHAEHVSGKEVAKVVVVQADGKNVMLVLPGDRKANLDQVKTLLSAKKITLASEAEMESLFAECQKGAMPPLGNLYNLPCYVDKQLANNAHIVFNAGTHRESIQMTYKDYEALTQPTLAEFSV